MTEATVASPRGVRWPGVIPMATDSGDSSGASSWSQTMDETPGTVLAPLMTAHAD